MSQQEPKKKTLTPLYLLKLQTSILLCHFCYVHYMLLYRNFKNGNINTAITLKSSFWTISSLCKAEILWPRAVMATSWEIWLYRQHRTFQDKLDSGLSISCERSSNFGVSFSIRCKKISYNYNAYLINNNCFIFYFNLGNDCIFLLVL